MVGITSVVEKMLVVVSKSVLVVVVLSVSVVVYGILVV